MQDWVIRVYHLLPFMAVLVMNFVSKVRLGYTVYVYSRVLGVGVYTLSYMHIVSEKTHVCVLVNYFQLLFHVFF
jgi:hypothetical protein